MNKKLFAVALLISTLTTFPRVALAQTQNPTVPTNNSQNAEKDNNIKKLLDITGAKNISQQITAQMLGSLKTQFPQVPQKFWDTFLAEVKSDEILNQMIPIYSKYFTNEEIKQMIDFYQTPLGKKTITVLPQITQESIEIGQKYGIEAAKRAIQKLEAEGYLRR